MSQAAGVIVFASQKGGSGKTTLSGHIAVEAERAGDGPVALIDTDPQGSLSKWWNARAAATPVFAQIPIAELGSGIAELRRAGVRLIVIDTPPAVTESITQVCAHADLVVIPTRPSPHDLRAVGPTVDIVERLRKPSVFVVNSATTRARITGETAVALSQHGVVAPVTLHHRVDYAASMIDGRTVGEVREDSRSAQEVTGLWVYLRDRLMRVEGLGGREIDIALASLTPASAPDMVDEEDDVETADAVSGLPALSPPVVPLRPQALSLPIPPIVPPPLPATPAKSEGWDGVDRRVADQGPPTGQVERRRVWVFGRRKAG